LQGNNLVAISELKSIQLSQAIDSLYDQVFAVTTRETIQEGLVNFYATGEAPHVEFPEAHRSLRTAIGTQQSLLEGRVYTNNFTLLPALTISHVDYDLPDSLIPTAPPVDMVNTPGELRGPVVVHATPGLYACSITIPIINVNGSTPSTLGYLSMIVSASCLQRVVNDTTGMGQTGQILLIAKHGPHYNVIFPPARTPNIYERHIFPGQYPAIDLTFKNRTGFLINTPNDMETPVSVGYTVFPTVKTID
jgi:osomolarity two-component system, sensor histidine kinase SLN1